MKLSNKSQLLKIATIIAFIALVLNEAGVDMYHGARDAWKNSGNGPGHDQRDLTVVLDGAQFIKQTGGVLKVDSGRTLYNINIKANLKAATSPVPYYLDIINVLLAFACLYVTIGIINRTYKVITAISNNVAFEPGVIKHIKRISYYFLAAFALMTAFEKTDLEEMLILAGPKLHPINAIEWPLGLLFAGFLILLIAQAFEQGMLLKEEQDLTV